MANRPDMFGPTRVFWDGRFNGTMQNVVGPTLVAMATTFWLGAEIQSPTGLFQYHLPCKASSVRFCSCSWVLDWSGQ